MLEDNKYYGFFADIEVAEETMVQYVVKVKQSYFVNSYVVLKNGSRMSTLQYLQKQSQLQSTNIIQKKTNIHNISPYTENKDEEYILTFNGNTRIIIKYAFVIILISASVCIIFA